MDTSSTIEPAVSASSSPGHSRRALLATLGAGALTLAASSATAQGSKGGASATQLRNRLVRRITYGGNEADVAQAKKLGYDAYLDAQLNFTSINDSACEREIAAYTALNLSPAQLLTSPVDAMREDLTGATLVRAVRSERQLYQRMVEFWTDHFNIYWRKCFGLTIAHNRDVIRPHALGNFHQMLMAHMKSPAALRYLDNQLSTKKAPNQNLARELMELYTIGPAGGYTQEDVAELARCLTGWDYYADLLQPAAGTFYFNAPAHDDDAKLFMGRVIPAGGGIADAETAIQMLLTNRNTGVTLSRKLCQFFLGYEPAGVVNEVADLYLSTGGDIKSMVRAVLRQSNVSSAPAMLKRPFHFAAGLLRQTNASITAIKGIRIELNEMGQYPFEWLPPDGYPLGPEHWAAHMLPRWNFSFEFFSDAVYGLKVSQTGLLKGATTLRAVLDRINLVLYAGDMTTADLDRIKAILVNDASAVSKSMTAFSNAATLPSYEKC